MKIIITVVWLQNNQSRSLHNRTDNLINPFSTNILLLYPLETSEKVVFWCFQGVWKWNIGRRWLSFARESYKQYDLQLILLDLPFCLFLLFFPQLSFILLHPSCNLLVCFTVLFLEIILKTIWNCIIVFFDTLIRKRITYAMYTKAIATYLEHLFIFEYLSQFYTVVFVAISFEAGTNIRMN